MQSSVYGICAFRGFAALVFEARKTYPINSR
jgi:hypothetical protein